MSKRTTLGEKTSKPTEKQVDKLFQPTTNQIEDEQIEDKINWEPRRQTYYIPGIIIDAIGFKKAFEDKDISEIVREALESYIEEKYIEMAREKYKAKEQKSGEEK